MLYNFPITLNSDVPPHDNEALIRDSVAIVVEIIFKVFNLKNSVESPA